MIAVAILGSAGLVAVMLTREAVASVEHARQADRQLASADGFLDAVALWPREDLDLRLGDRAQGQWRLRIDRPLPTLYVVVLTDSASHREILRTSLYRPAPDL